MKYIINIIIRLFYILFLSLLSLTIIVNAEMIHTTIDEEITTSQIDTDKFEIYAVGEISINNPTEANNIYEYAFKFKENRIFQVGIDDPKNELQFSNKKILGRFISPDSTKKFTYSLHGTLPKNLLDEFKEANESLFEWYLDDYYYYPLKYASLTKFERADKTEGKSTRLVEIDGTNPTNFNVSLSFLNLYKTDDEGYLEFYDDLNVLNTYKIDHLGPQENFQYLYFDHYSDDTSVYWIEFSVRAKNELISNFNIVDLGIEPDLPEIDETNYSSEEPSFEYKQKVYEDPIIFSKISSTGIISYRDIFNITLLLMNPNNKSLYNITIGDSYSNLFKTIPSRNKTDLTFQINELKPFETKEITYSLNFSQNTLEKLIYFSFAKLEYDNWRVYSNSLNLINDISSEKKKIFIEKLVTRNLDDTSTVKIRIKNIGSVDLENLFVFDEDTSLTKKTEGELTIDDVWKIQSLKLKAEWETTYTISSKYGTNLSIPQVYGEPDLNVYHTVIVNDAIEQAPIKTGLKFHEKILIGVGLMLLFVDIIY